MNWDAVGAIGEVIGAVAVVVSLLYLAGQVKHMRETSVRNTRHMRNTGIREIFTSISSSPTLSDAWMKVEASLGDNPILYATAESLAEKTGTTVKEANQVICHTMALYHQYRTAYYSDLTAAEKAGLEANMQHFFRSDIAQFMIRSLPLFESDEFAQRMIGNAAPPNKAMETDT